MRKLFSYTITVFLLLMLSTTSCEKPDDLILGRWNQVTVITTLYEDDVQTDVWTYTFEPNEVVREYKEGGTGTIYNYGTVLETFTWEIDGDILITDSSESKFTVSKTHLKITWVYEETIQGVIHRQIWEYFFTRA